MSGIAGAWNLDGRPMTREVISGMNSRLAHRGRDGHAVRLGRTVGLAHQHLWVTPEERGERQPLGEADGTSPVLLMDGRIDNRAELVTGFRLDASWSDAQLVRAAYCQIGEACIERLNGDFAIAIFDPRHRQLVLARDAIGLRSLYYSYRPPVFAFASEIKALLAHPEITAVPDEEGLADFMWMGSRPLDRQDRTCFEGISAVAPAQLVVVKPDGITQRQYWDFATEDRLTLGSFDEYADAFRERFVQAILRRSRTDRPVAVAVSGGLDSSSIFCQLEALRRDGAASIEPLAGISYVSNRAETDEQQFLREIETTYGVEIDRFAIEPLTGLVRTARRQIEAVEAPFVDYLWGVTEELQRRAVIAGARTLLSGHWGDQMLFSTRYLIDLLRRGRFASVWQHTREYGHYFGNQDTSSRRRQLLVDLTRYHVPRALAPPLKWLRLRLTDRRQSKAWLAPSFLQRGLRDRYRLATVERRFHSAHAEAVYLEVRSKYPVQCMEWNAKVGALHGIDVAYPFLDRDLIAFLMSIPGEIHANRGVPRALLRHAMQGVLPDSIRSRTWKSDFTQFVNTGVVEDAEAIRRTLGPECLGVRFGLFNRDRLVSEVDRLAGNLEKPDCLNSWDLGDTFGLEMWLRVFCEPPA